MLARVWTGSVVGINAVKVGVEIDVSGGLPGIVVVGLPDTAVQVSAVDDIIWEVQPWNCKVYDSVRIREGFNGGSGLLPGTTATDLQAENSRG